MARPVKIRRNENRDPGRSAPEAPLVPERCAYSRMNGSPCLMETIWPLAVNRAAVYWYT